MASTFPTFVLLKCNGDKHSFFAYEADCEGVPHSIVLESEIGAHNPLAKIQLEPAKIDSKYFHLRFCHVNRYCAVNNAKDGFVIAESKKPEEDKSKLSCTLFEAIRADEDDILHLIHVHTGWRLQMDGFPPLRLCVAEEDSYWNKFCFVDWDTIVKLPEHVAIKGDNGKYLQAHWVNHHPFLQFSSDDPYDKRSGFRVELRPDGYVRIKSDDTGMCWRLSPAWIWADEKGYGGGFDRLYDAFWLVKTDDSTIALRNGENNRYCKRLTAEHNYDCLNAGIDNITKEARLVVEELVQERKVRGVIYRMDDSRIFDETPYLAGTASVVNNGDQEAAVEVEIEYKDETAKTFTHDYSITAGVQTTFETGVPCIVEGKIEVSLEVSAHFEWSKTTTTTKTVKATGKVPVPARHMAIVHYVGTKGCCNVPFSYTQQDRSSTDGKITYSVQNDGMFTGINAYNFQFVVEKAQPI